MYLSRDGAHQNDMGWGLVGWLGGDLIQIFYLHLELFGGAAKIWFCALVGAGLVHMHANLRAIELWVWQADDRRTVFMVRSLYAGLI